MKKIATFAFATSLLALMVPTEAFAWYCYASSPSAYGYGINSSRSAAVRRALAECAVRTPRYQACYIRYCE